MAAKKEAIKRLPDDRQRRLDIAGEGVLGALLLDPSSFARIDLAAEDFGQRYQREVFSVIAYLVGRDKRFDAVLVTKELLDRKIPGPYETGNELWSEFIAKLYQDTASAANIEAYAEIVRQESLVRRSREIAMNFLNTDVSPNSVPLMIAELMKATTSKVRRARRIADDIPAFIDSLDQLQSGEHPGLTTGIPKLDHFLGGWMESDLYLIAARSSMGKTAAMMNFSHALFDVPHGIISAEQPARQLLQRYCALIGEVNAQRIRLGQLDDGEWAKVSKALEVVSKAPIFIEDSSNIRIDEVAQTARRWKFREGIKALFVDYAQRIRARRGDSRAVEVGDVARGLKDIARELNIPVIALAQLNREADRRATGKPMLADLRESGDLEQEADGVIAIYRPSVYDDSIEDKRKTELIVLKNRHGPLGYTEVEFFHEFMRFTAYRDVAYEGPQRAAYFA